MEGANNLLGEILGAPNYHEVVQAQGTFVSSMLDSLKSVNMAQADQIVKAIKSVGWDALEQTREQVMCRSGGTGPGSTHRITFKEAGSKQKAIAMAKVWVQKQLKKA